MLKLEGIRKVFNRRTASEKIALRNTNLTLREGDFVTIIGSNGAGKSTLMNIISGGMAPDSGTIEIDGENVTGLSEFERSRKIGRVFQDPMAGTAPTMTIEENLAVAFSRDKRRTLNRGVNKKRKELFRESLASLHLGLENRLSAKAGLLSGGERQALSLLMATFTQPKVLLLDEHTAALDPARAQLITALTKEVVERSNFTTLMVTHNMQQAIELGNRLIMMDAGEIILDVREEEKKHLTIEVLLKKFAQLKGVADDRLLLG
ncbi:ATP-binding cassette domain-containing protein [Paenibacillus thiaminolyticus]|uniref:ABC transporter ATP-binding protein n=1 Tax=Paenibacillus thiaminolyticus TaxID=49283 RepID=UPI003D273B67